LIVASDRRFRPGDAHFTLEHWRTEHESRPGRSQSWDQLEAENPSEDHVADVPWPAQRKVIAQAKNINNSEVDLCEFKGKTIIYYSWGNQQGTEFLAESVYEGTLANFLRGYFP
jgi:hypothetical protein